MLLISAILLLCSCSDPVYEICDGVDNDSDGLIDENFDLDGDGFFAASEPDCYDLGVPLDCDDNDDGIFPGAEELCDELDNDCNGEVDDAEDGDLDGWSYCDDCDDDDAFINPDAAEVCDGIDNDCSGLADEPWDEDGDLVSSCAGDCNDRDPNVSPLMEEICDGIDNNCDDVADEGFDEDGDGNTTCGGDCDDTDPLINISAEEICDGLDNDCDGIVLEETDPDGDGYNICNGDCMENNPFISPDAEELCNDRDDNCDGIVDAPSCFGCEESGDYLSCSDRNTWQEAEWICEQFDYTLAIVTSQGENELLAAAALEVTPFGNVWLGATDFDVEGTWVWADGSNMTFDAWASGMPSGGALEDCLVLSGSELTWVDDACSGKNSFICER